MRAKSANAHVLPDILAIRNIGVAIEGSLKIAAQNLIRRVNVDIEENINIAMETVILIN